MEVVLVSIGRCACVPGRVKPALGECEQAECAGATAIPRTRFGAGRVRSRGTRRNWRISWSPSRRPWQDALRCMRVSGASAGLSVAGVASGATALKEHGCANFRGALVREVRWAFANQRRQLSQSSSQESTDGEAPHWALELPQGCVGADQELDVHSASRLVNCRHGASG